MRVTKPAWRVPITANHNCEAISWHLKKTRGVTLLELAVVLAVIMVISGAVFIGISGNTNDYRTLHNAAVALQADMRYAQRRAVMEGRRFNVHFEPSLNRYSIVTWQPSREIHRIIYFQDGITLRLTSFDGDSIGFLPRGTGVAGTIVLSNGRYWQKLTTTVSGGRVYIYPITTTPIS